MYKPLIWLVTSVSPSTHATPPSDAHTEQHPLAVGGGDGCGGGEGGEDKDGGGGNDAGGGEDKDGGGGEDAGAANEQAPQAVWLAVAIILHALMRASSLVWSVLCVELGLLGSYASQSTLSAQVDCLSGMSASSRPPSHATPPSDAHTEQHTPADGGAGGGEDKGGGENKGGGEDKDGGGGEDAEEEKFAQQALQLLFSLATNWQANAVPLRR